MIRGCVLAVLVACLPALALAGEEASPPPPALEITYVANEGFLVQAAGRKIAIDTFFEGETIDWCDAPAPGTVEKMRSAKGPFEGIDLILVTHGHVDHFSPGLVLAHLSSNPKTVVVASPQVTSRLRSDPAWNDRYETRIRKIDVPLFGSREVTVDGIRVEAHRIRHGAYMIKDEATGRERNK
ncbi:MAG TPA: MBL fold metallo-hydrolase, partial [Candidatus Saccharimonadales bacterium]|nr:MBL fold metallo-hydrolase [Candidatus Saccharimonadales bacterium]